MFVPATPSAVAQNRLLAFESQVPSPEALGDISVAICFPIG
jgi:hypothetical protein